MREVAAIAIINDHHMLMGKRRDNGKWTNPGGHLNASEDPRHGAVREVKEETGLTLNPHLFKHIETRVVAKPSGEKIKVHGYRVDLPQKPSTSMREDPDNEVFRWLWIKLDTDLEHIKDNLHVPLGDNVLLDRILKEKPMRKARKFWDSSRKMGKEGFMTKEGSISTNVKSPSILESLKELGFKDVPSDSSIPSDKLKKGIEVEKEHTSNPEVAKIIAKGHYKEFPPKDGKRDYYKELDKMETHLKGK